MLCHLPKVKGSFARSREHPVAIHQCRLTIRSSRHAPAFGLRARLNSNVGRQRHRLVSLRTAFSAGLLSLLAPGTGHLFLGRARRFMLPAAGFVTVAVVRVVDALEQQIQVTALWTPGMVLSSCSAVAATVGAACGRCQI